MQQALNVVHLLRQFPHARLNILHVVGKALRLRGHGVDARAGIGLHFLHGFLDERHLSIQLVHGIRRLLNQRPQRGAIGIHGAAQALLRLRELVH